MVNHKHNTGHKREIDLEMKRTRPGCLIQSSRTLKDLSIETVGSGGRDKDEYPWGTNEQMSKRSE